MNDLEKYFNENPGNMMDKWKHYFDIYDRYFSRYRGTEVHVVEFGVWHGGSMHMWTQYFGPKAHIYGIDINPHCKQLEGGQVQIFIGDQENKQFLKSLANHPQNRHPHRRRRPYHGTADQHLRGAV